MHAIIRQKQIWESPKTGSTLNCLASACHKSRDCGTAVSWPQMKNHGCAPCQAPLKDYWRGVLKGL